MTTPEGTRLYVSGVPDGLRKEDLAEHFKESSRDVTDMWIARSPGGFAFVRVRGTREYVDEFVNKFSNTEIKGSTITLEISRNQRGPQKRYRDDYGGGEGGGRTYGGGPRSYEGGYERRGYGGGGERRGYGERNYGEERRPPREEGRYDERNTYDDRRERRTDERRGYDDAQQQPQHSYGGSSRGYGGEDRRYGGGNQRSTEDRSGGWRE